MCGFVGVYAEGRGRDWARRVETAGRLLAHRGPDDDGTFSDDDVAFAFRRLSIIDVERGAQPMRVGDSVIAHNGEVYNFRELRSRLGDEGFATESDTEVVARCLNLWGRGALNEFDGMFALAHYDTESRRLLLARDRHGVKPLYYAREGGVLAFASEIRALLALLPRRAVNYRALDLHLALLFNPAEETAFAGIFRLPPGAWLERRGESERTRRYYTPQIGVTNASEGALEEALAETLVAAVRSQTVSDVPIGLFLSGGVDSSLIASCLPGAFAVTCAFSPEDTARDIIRSEVGEAREAARVSGLELKEVEISFDEGDFASIVNALEEPIGDPAALSTALLARNAGRKVMLSGAGGDELFGGYPRLRALLLAERLAPLRPLAPLAARALGALPAVGGGVGHAVRSALKLSRGLAAPPEKRYAYWLSYADGRSPLLSPRVAEALRGTPTPLETLCGATRYRDRLDRALFTDLALFLPFHNLTYTDKASMAHGVEMRVPFLSNRLVDLALTIPHELRVRRGVGKYLLRKLAAKRLPPRIARAAKRGFGAPVLGWLRRSAAPARLLDEERLRSQGLFDPAAVERLRRSVARGESYDYLQLYEVLTVTEWHDRFFGGVTTP